MKWLVIRSACFAVGPLVLLVLVVTNNATTRAAIPPRSELQSVAGRVEATLTVFEGSSRYGRVDTYRINIRQEDGTLRVGDIGRSLLSAEARRSLAGKDIEVAVERNDGAFHVSDRVYGLQMGGRTVIDYASGQGYWEARRRNEIEFFAVMSGLALLGVAAIGIWAVVDWRRMRRPGALQLGMRE